MRDKKSILLLICTFAFSLLAGCASAAANTVNEEVANTPVVEETRPPTTPTPEPTPEPFVLQDADLVPFIQIGDLYATVGIDKVDIAQNVTIYDNDVVREVLSTFEAPETYEVDDYELPYLVTVNQTEYLAYADAQEKLATSGEPVIFDEMEATESGEYIWTTEIPFEGLTPGTEYLVKAKYLVANEIAVDEDAESIEDAELVPVYEVSDDLLSDDFGGAFVSLASMIPETEAGTIYFEHYLPADGIEDGVVVVPRYFIVPLDTPEELVQVEVIRTLHVLEAEELAEQAEEIGITVTEDGTAVAEVEVQRVSDPAPVTTPAQSIGSNSGTTGGNSAVVVPVVTPPPAAEVRPTPTPKPAEVKPADPTPTPAPTAKPVTPTNAPAPTAVPTTTQKPAVTSTPMPTATAKPAATTTPVPTPKPMVTATPSPTPHVHQWTTTTVHHDAETHWELQQVGTQTSYQEQKVVDREGYYEYLQSYLECLVCGFTTYNENEMGAHSGDTGHNYHVVTPTIWHEEKWHLENVPVEEPIMDLVEVVDKEAWDETTTVCPICGATK